MTFKKKGLIPEYSGNEAIKMQLESYKSSFHLKLHCPGYKIK